MAWTATITQPQYRRNDGAIVIDVQFTDGTTRIVRSIPILGMDLVAFKAAVQQQIDQFTNADNANLKLPLGPFDPTPTPPTAPEIAKANYAIDLARLRHMAAAIQLAIKTSGDSDYTTLLADLKTRFLTTYLDLF